MITPPLFRAAHAASGRLHRRMVTTTAGLHRDLLHGDRQFGWPMAALSVQQDLGSVRHALSQMVVAGTMTIFPPIGSVDDTSRNHPVSHDEEDR